MGLGVRQWMGTANPSGLITMAAAQVKEFRRVPPMVSPKFGGAPGFCASVVLGFLFSYKPVPNWVLIKRSSI